MSIHGGGRKPGLARVGTVSGPDEARDWQEKLRVQGIASILRGHRAEGDTERRPSFTGVDVFVPAAHLAQARATLGLRSAPDDKPFPWLLLVGGPIAILIVLVGLTLILS
jgi:hypothetical protein